MKRYFLPLLLVLLASCHKTTPDNDTQVKDPTTYYANLFAFNLMYTYYLWADEETDAIKSWSYGDNPIEKVASLRYKDANGNLVDRWTELMEDCSSFENSITGNGKTFGMEFILLRNGKNGVVMEITYTYANSPARKAGLKRGDVITAVDGQELTMDNYVDLLTEKVYDFPGTITLGMLEGDNVQMSAVEMYADPVHVVKTLDAGGKKMGYIHFTNFTWDASLGLVEAFKQLKAEGIEELILDLRYNTGGYSITAQVLGSLIAPLNVVQSKEVFNKEVYNSRLSASMDEERRFAASYTLEGYVKPLNTLEANPGVKHLWVITTGHSASASESLICGLYPYMDVTLVGSTTYGKFCGGFLIKSDRFYDALAQEDSDVDCQAGKKATEGWGIYVIASRYADCNGITRSMPSGIPADYPADDDPRDGFDLGDPSESMLSVVLGLASGKPVTAAPAHTKAPQQQPLPFHKPGFGVLLY